MTSRFDGGTVLAAIATHPASFPAVKTDIDATARKLLLKQLRAASFDLKLLMQVMSAVGEPALRTGFDEMTEKDLSSVARRLDPANAALSGLTELEISDHLCALARGEAKPVAGKKVPARASPKRPAKELSKIGEVLNSKVHSGKQLRAPAKPKSTRVTKSPSKSN